MSTVLQCAKHNQNSASLKETVLIWNNFQGASKSCNMWNQSAGVQLTMQNGILPQEAETESVKSACKRHMLTTAKCTSLPTCTG